MTPYTYLLGWTNLNKYYYGVRFAKNSHPSELCKTYFSSSKYVKEMITEHGLPNVVNIRKTFKDSISSRKWENKVLRRLNVVSENKWINKTDNISISPEVCAYKHTTEIRIKKSLSHIGKKHSEKTRQKMSDSQKGKPRLYLKGKKRPEHSLLMKEMQKQGGFAKKQKTNIGEIKNGL